MTRMYVPDEVFCKAVVDAGVAHESAESVANRLNLQVTTVKSRANKLRKAGVPLPKFPAQRKRVDVEALAKMVSEYTALQSVEDTDEDKKVDETTEITETNE